MLKKAISILFGLLAGLALCEVALRIYNPFPARVRGDEIVLRSNYTRTFKVEPPRAGLDSEVHYHLNSIGFRGPEPPGNDAAPLKVFTVGGSTTECSMLSDDSTWTARLFDILSRDVQDLWMNNAGIDGMSSHGHIILLRDHLLALGPDMILFLVGINDRGKLSFEREDGYLISREEPLLRKLVKRSELAMLVSNILEKQRTERVGLAHEAEHASDHNMDRPSIDREVAFHRAHIGRYLGRLDTLAAMCIENAVTPVFISQSLNVDPGCETWHVMQVYNNALAKFCEERGLPFIDLASAMPSGDDYYYDSMHYNNPGAERVARILAPAVKKFLAGIPQ